jgi:hypothetical protein
LAAIDAGWFADNGTRATTSGLHSELKGAIGQTGAASASAATPKKSQEDRTQTGNEGTVLQHTHRRATHPSDVRFFDGKGGERVAFFLKNRRLVNILQPRALPHPSRVSATRLIVGAQLDESNR